MLTIVQGLQHLSNTSVEPHTELYFCTYCEPHLCRADVSAEPRFFPEIPGRENHKGERNLAELWIRPFRNP
jgi:hypothetical protein